MISTRSVYDKELPEGAFRVLVMRRWPRGVSKQKVDVEIREAAPSADLLWAYRNLRRDPVSREMMTWDVFASEYRGEMNKRHDTLKKLKELEHKHGHIVLLCWEKDPNKCHRTILKDILDGMDDWKE